jgi:hypothetical protein
LRRLQEQCTPQRKTECAKNSGEMLEYMCSRCERREPYEPSPWFTHIYFLYRLHLGGYPFHANDLTTDEWLGIGEMKEAIESLRWRMK